MAWFWWYAVTFSMISFVIGQEIPRFSVQPSNTNVAESTTAEIDCSATGLPAPRVVSWMKDGIHIRFDGSKSIVGSGRLRISYVARSDTGYYQCVAQNSIASVISRRAKLNVAFFDQIFSSPIYETKNAGTSFIQARPSVSINPLPKAIYRWKKNQVNLVENGRISFSRDNGLYIADLTSSDAGRYTCEVENSVMAAAGRPNSMQVAKVVVLTISASVPRYSAPSLMRSPSDTTARQGMDHNINMECFPNRSDTSITWRKNGAVLYPSSKYRFDSTRKRLTISEPKKVDEGQYSCEASILRNRVSGSGQLHVIVPPAFLTSNMVTNAFSDNSTIIWCNATAYPSYQWKWYHNSKPVLPSGNRVVLHGNGSLSIRALTWQDGGVYQCIAQNNAGQAIALTRLNVQNITARIRIPLKDSYFHVGSTAVVPCYTVGAPQPTIRWLRNGAAIPPSMPRISTTSKGYLQITNAIKADSGRFTCIANNGGGDAMSTAYVGIVDPTVITKGPNATTIAQRAVTVWLPCEVKHDPTVNVTREWRKNTGRLYDPRYTMLSDGRLQIVSTQEADAATFSCNVFSNGGNASVSTVLRIVSLPLSPSTPVASAISTNSLDLTWLAPEDNGGIALKDYELQMKNETGNIFRTIRIVTQLSVQVSNLLAGVKYSFRVAARNELGRGRWSGNTPWIPMKIEAPSRPPTNLHVVATEQTKINLRWTPPPFEYHNGKLKGYNVYYRVEGYKDSAFTIRKAPPGSLSDKVITYSLDNLLTFTRYEIKVAAYNDAGVGVMSQLITAETKPGVPSVAPTNVSINVLNSSSASVSYRAPQQIYWNGHLISSRGYAYKPEDPLNVYTFDADYNHATRYNQSFIMMGLKANTPYALRVAVVTASGAGPKSQPVFFRMQEGSPGTPRNFMVTATYAHSILLRWDAPYVTNGVLRGYKVGHRKYGWGAWIHRAKPEPAESGGAVYRGLELNTRYEFYVLAFTSAGDGGKVSIDAQTRQSAPTLPGKPTKPILVKNNGTSITLSWVMDETGGTLMSYYLIEANNQTNYKNLPEANRHWYLVVNLTRIQDIPTRIKNLTTNTVYRFRVTPVNSVGRGPTSNVSEDILTAESRPSASPTNLRASAHGRQSLLIEWVPPPKYTWGSNAIFYKIKLVSIGKRDRDERIVHQRDSQSRQYIAGSLAKWTWFNITIAVYNNVGYGPVSWPVRARTAEDVPDNGPATITPVPVSSSVVNVSWTPVPADIRNGIILGYYIYYNIRTEPLVVNRKQIIGADTLASVLTGLAGYATYQIRMSAYTKTGEGKKTDPVEFVTPDGIAGKPYKVRFPVVRTDFAQVTWLPPLRPNGAIISYEVQHKVKDSSDKFAVVYQPRNGPDILSADVNGLIGNRYYIFRVYAKTRLGRGIPAEEIVFTTPNRQVPESPVMLPIPLSDVDATTVLVKWKPRDDGKSPVRFYTLQVNKQPDGWKDYLSNVTGRVDIDASVTQLLVTRLLPSSSYSFRIKATNDVGNSAWSQASNTVLTHPAAPKGAPRNLKIRPLSPTSLKIEWQAPSFEDLGGLPVEFLLRYREQGKPEWSPDRRLPKTPLSAQIDNLRGYTAYEISMAAINVQGPGPWTKKIGITGESPPTDAPTNILLSAEDATTIKVRWTPPPINTIRGNLLGYKIEYQRLGPVRGRKRRRRRRSTDTLCPLEENGVKIKFAGPYVQEETIKSAGKFSRFKITVRAYNGAGDGPKSKDRYVNTPEGTPSAPIILWSRSYINDIDVQWKLPCSPNGYISAYERKYWQIGSSDVKTREFAYNRFTDRISGLKHSTTYKIQLRAATRGKGFGDATFLTLKTKGPFPGPELPGSPGKPKILSVAATSVKLSWKEGPDGNSPIENYMIQYSKAGENWRTGWVVRYDQWGRNSSIIFYTVDKLDPDTQYSFRVVAENRVGASLASDTVSLKTFVEKKKPFHAELWFILLIVVVAILLVALLILFICIKRRNEKSKYSPDVSTKERQLQQQACDLKLLQTRPHSEFLSAYGEEDMVDVAVAEEAVEESDKRKSDVCLPKDIVERLNSGTATMRDRKNRLEKLDLKPLAFEIPKVPDDAPKKIERRAPEGEENITRKDGLSSPLKRFPKGSHDETRFSGSDATERKGPSSVEYISESDEKPSLSDTDSDVDYPTVIRKHPHQSHKNGRSEAGFYTNPNYEDFDGSRQHQERTERRSEVSPRKEVSTFTRSSALVSDRLRANSHDDLSERHRRSGDLEHQGAISPQDLMAGRGNLRKTRANTSYERDNRRSAVSREDLKASRESLRKPKGFTSEEKERRGEISRDELMASRESLRKPRALTSHEKSSRTAHGYRSDNNNRERLHLERRDTKPNHNPYEERFSVTKSLRPRSRSSSSVKRNRYSLDCEDEVFLPEDDTMDRRHSRESLEREPRTHDDTERGTRGRSPRSKTKNRDYDRAGNRRSRGSQRSLSYTDDNEDVWEVDVDNVPDTSARRTRNDDNDSDYRKLVNNLTKGRVRSMYDDELDETEFVDRRARSRSHKDAVKANEKPGLSSFELAMVRNKGGSAQRLINSDTESVARSSRSLASQASKKPRPVPDKKSLKETSEERSSSSISKHSIPSDNDADKSEESEEEGKLMRGGAGATSIASHYANDPFYKNWRNSLDKKTRKAILTDYHHRHKKAAPHESVESFGSSRPYRSASEEGLDRIARPRVRPGRADLSEKKKLAQSDPYLNQEPAPSVSSFTPSGEGERPPVRRPGKRPIARAAARSEPSLNVQDSDSDQENRFPPPYEDENARRRKNSFLRATKGSEQSLRKGSVDNLEDAGPSKKDLAAELDKAVNYYARAPPPYEENPEYEVDEKSPPAYTPRQDSSDDSRPNVGYNRGKRNWRPQRQNSERHEIPSPRASDSREDSYREDDEFDGPSRTSMTLV